MRRGLHRGDGSFVNPCIDAGTDAEEEDADGADGEAPVDSAAVGEEG